MTGAALLLLAHAAAPLAPFFEDPETEDVAVNRPGLAWVRRRGAWERHETPELDFATLEGIAILSAAVRGQDVGPFAPLLATEAPGPGGALLRLQACLPPAVPAGTVSLTWRRPGDGAAPLEDLPRRYRTEGWNRWEGRHALRAAASGRVLAAFDAGDAPGFLAEAMRARLNVWLCASTGGGKTTLLKSLMREVPEGERIVTVEDAAELVVPQPNAVRLLYSHGGDGTVTAEDLMVAALRMRPDRIPLQEVRTGQAAWVYLNGIMTGHPGSPTTIHGRTPAEAFRRMFALCKGTPGGGAMDDARLARMIADAVDVIIPLHSEAGAFRIGEVWFKDDAARRGETAADLLARD
jgi:type IV secretion system protein VirB11